MNTLEELVDYCNEKEPVGALLLTGEWGCGKTYFITHNLAEVMKDNAVILRISLFGVTSAEEINNAVKNAWLKENMGFSYGYVKKNSRIQQVVNAIKNADGTPNWLKTFISIDITAFFPLKNKLVISPKKGQETIKNVILVFDDLERCGMDNFDVLGIINNYCENQKFHTIIIANEKQLSADVEKKNSEDDLNNEKYENNSPKKLSYSEIKEKIIGRTVKYDPDYKLIVSNVVDEFKKIHKGNNYSDFLGECKTEIVELFASGSHDDFAQEKPHNIRILKCALNDFERIHKEFKKFNLQIYLPPKILLNFLAYTLVYKSNLIDDKVYWESEVKNRYHSFEGKYVMNCEKEWVENGYWNEDAFKYEINEMILTNSDDPLNVLKCSDIFDVEDEIIQKLYPNLLECAYNGELTLTEYVRLIKNSSLARMYSIRLPSVIDWNKVDQGLNKKINELFETPTMTRLILVSINENDFVHLTTEELNTYNKILEFDKGVGYVCELNQRKYVEEMRAYTENTFNYLENKKYYIFNKEMADATLHAYYSITNNKRNDFNSRFELMWRSKLTTKQLKLLESQINFNYLKEELIKYKDKLNQNNQQIAAFHTNSFIYRVDEILKKIDQKKTHC